MDLSILIPARNEMFLKDTIDDILKNMRGETEVIAVLDGAWADPRIPDHERVHIIYHSQSIGQRAATNEAARLSRAKYVMKCDAHCAFDEGFDVKLMANCEKDWTVIPRMYNLHVFDWKCKKCGHQVYQGPYPTSCEKCDNVDKEGFERLLIYKPRLNKETDFARFDNDLHFQYWGACKKREESKKDIADLMCFVGACFFMHRERYWEIDGLDERHGSWGQMGVEISCKSWLSGGRMVVNKKTWFSHLFRTQPGFGFPYPNPGITKAREHSKNMWMKNGWEKQKYPLKWLLNKFAPVPDWDQEVVNKLPEMPGVKRTSRNLPLAPSQPRSVIPAPAIIINAVKKEREKGLVYYTDNKCEPRIMAAVQAQLKRCADAKNLYLVSVSLSPIPSFGSNYVLEAERGILTMFKQILLGLQKCPAEYVFLVEHDLFYHPTHFDFTPPVRDAFYYNENTYKVDALTGQALFYYTKQTSGLCADRDLLIEHYRKRVEKVERDGFSRHMGFEPGCHSYPRGVDNFKAERWMSEFPNIDIRHTTNLTPSRWSQDQFRNANACLGWEMCDEVRGWGVTKYRFWELLREVAAGEIAKV
jgi:glycosyltransferase involved in cell wall biosynthesis